MANGDLIKLGTLTINGVKQLRPTKPWRGDMTPNGAPSEGNIPTYSYGKIIEITNTDSVDAYKLQWREVTLDNKKLLISDRVILTNISWSDLNDKQLITGKIVTIDSQQYKLRVITGGVDKRDSSLSGAIPTNNEWDRIVVNESLIPGLLTPSVDDLSSSNTAKHYSSAHNQFWNWYQIGSISQEISATGVDYRTNRGQNTVAHWSANTKALTDTVSGWRPVLEVLNSSPTTTLNTENNRTLYENDTLSIDGSATDADNGNIVNVKYSLNGGTIRAIATAISNGTTPIPFAKILTCKNGKLYDGDTAVTDTLVEGMANTLRVWAEDDKGGKSTDQVRTFYVVPNRAATITVDQMTPVSSLIGSDKVTVSASVNDPENQEVVVKYKVNDGAYIEVYRGLSSSFTFDIPVSALKDGNNQITLQATDSYGFITTKSFVLAKAANKVALKDSTERYVVTPPKGTAQGIIVWVQREVGDLTVGANVSMTAKGEQEQFVAMSLSNTAPVSEGVVEDEFVYDAGAAKEHIVLEVNLHRENVTSTAAVRLISGVLS